MAALPVSDDLLQQAVHAFQETGNKQKAADLKTKLKRLFLSQDKFDILVKVVQDVKELATLNPSLADLNPNSLGLAYDDKVYLIADNIPQGQDFAVLMHELGVHIGMNKMLGEKTISDLSTQIKTWASKDDGSSESKVAKTTMENVNDAIESYKKDGNPASDELIKEETVAYFVEAAVNNGINPLALSAAKPNTIQAWMKKLIDAFKDALRKIGVGRFEQLTAQNIVDLAYGAAHIALQENKAQIQKTGKTQFAYHMCLKYPTKCQIMNSIGRISSFAQNMKNFQDMGWRGNTIFLNLSRSYCDRTSIYEALEIIADGLITCTMYTGGQIWLGKMHVVVLSNFYPQLEKLSQDRWDIWCANTIKCTFARKTLPSLSDQSSKDEAEEASVTLKEDASIADSKESDLESEDSKSETYGSDTSPYGSDDDSVESWDSYSSEEVENPLHKPTLKRSY